MKRQIFIILFSFVLFTAAQAEDHETCDFQGKIVSLDQIGKEAETMGYTVIKKYQDDCIFKAKVHDKAGKKWKLYFNPVTGKLVGKKAEDKDDDD